MHAEIGSAIDATLPWKAPVWTSRPVCNTSTVAAPKPAPAYVPPPLMMLDDDEDLRPRRLLFAEYGLSLR